MLGRILLLTSATFQLLGPFWADWNETHIFNKRWPPHAKFHNGQTMSMGVCMALATVYYALRPVDSDTAAADSVFTAAIFGSVYWLTGLTAALYPGSKGIDPEFGTGFPQFKVFVGLVGATWMGWWLETRGF